MEVSYAYRSYRSYGCTLRILKFIADETLLHPDY